jgi:hypothetical protein
MIWQERRGQGTLNGILQYSSRGEILECSAIKAGLLKRKSAAGFGTPVISRLTWQGHEFLNDVRDQTIWSKTKERLKGLPDVAPAIVWRNGKG